MPDPRAADPELLAAVRLSFLAELEEPIVSELIKGGYRLDLPAGAEPRPSGADHAAGIVLAGLLRVLMESDGGRQVTVRYARPGETLGLVHLIGRATPTRAQAVTRAAVWLLPPSVLRELGGRHASLAMALAKECANRAADAMDELLLSTFGSVRARVARHLLDLAAPQAEGDALIASVTQQQLADASGSVREVVARVLKQLHEAGLTEPCDAGVTILDAAGLDAETSGQAARAT